MIWFLIFNLQFPEGLSQVVFLSYGMGLAISLRLSLRSAISLLVIVVIWVGYCGWGGYGRVGSRLCCRLCWNGKTQNDLSPPLPEGGKSGPSTVRRLKFSFKPL